MRPLPKSSERQDKVEDVDPSVFDEFLKANGSKLRGFEAPLKNVEAVRIATQKPYAEGVLEERKLFMELMSGTQAKAQQYFFFAERKAAKIDGSARRHAMPRDIKRVGVIGAGTMGGGISMNFLSRRHPGDDRRDGAGRARPRHRRDAQELRGERGQGQADRRAGRAGDGPAVNPTLDFEALADCDLIIEAVYENMDVKKEIFGRLDKIAKPGAILASNTSYLDVNEIAASHLAAAGRARHALLLARQHHEAARGRARRQDRARRAPDRDADRPRRSRKCRWSRACATASSATAC